MPDPALDPSIYQRLGWSPAADPTQPPPIPAPPGGPPDAYGGVSLPVAQRLGWAPPPTDAPLEAPTLQRPPTQLPSMAGQPPAPSTGGGAPDFKVPASAFGGGAGAAPPAAGTAPIRANQHGAPAPTGKPQSFDQQLAGLQQREAGTEQAQVGAINAGVEAQKQLHADQLAAYGTAQQTVAANAQQRAAEDDRFKKAYATNQAQVQADRAQIDNYKYNPNKYMDELGVGDHIRLAIGQILAGIGQGMMRQGGPNPVTEMIQQRIHDANVGQQQQRDALVQKLGFDRDTGQDAATYHATRQAELDKQDGLAYTALGKQLEAAALKSADPMAQARGLAEAANVRAMGDERLKSYIQLKSEHDVKQQEIGVAYSGQAETRRHNLVQEGFERYKEDQDAQIRAAALLAKQQGKMTDEERKFAGYAETQGPDGKPTGKVDVLRNADGTVWQARDADTARETSKLTSGAAVYNRLVGDMVRDIADHGGESDYFKSDAWKRQQSRLSEMQAELHDVYGIKRFSEGTQDLFNKMATGGVNPTSFVYDATNALQTSAKDLEAKVNDHLKHQGYTGRPVALLDTSAPTAPPSTPEERSLGRALVNPAVLYDREPERVGSELGVNTKGLRAGEIAPKVAQALRDQGGILPSVRQNMDTWAAAMASPDPEISARFRKTLEKIASDSEGSATASYAEQLLARERQRQLETAPGAANAPEVQRGSSGAPRSP